MKLLTAAQMRELDRKTIEEYGTAGEILMDRAGRGVAHFVCRALHHLGALHPSVLLLAGKGNNGGDAFVAARYLRETGVAVRVLLAGEQSQIQGDALHHLNRMLDAGIPLDSLPAAFTKPDLRGPHLVVDGVLGTGSTGPARGEAGRAVRCINTLAPSAFVVAVDVPSGLNADTGEVEGEAVRADLTVTMGLPKRGLIQPPALDYVGSLETIDIGIPPSYIERLPIEGIEFISSSELRAMQGPRPRDAHKGTYGHALLIGGAPGFSGAISLAARAAVRSGAGLVSVLTPRGIATRVSASADEIMVSGGPETETGSLSASCITEWRDHLNAFDVIMIGPGITRHHDTFLLTRQLLKEAQVPLVLDADAITVFAGQPHWLERADTPLVLTPHPGELSRLFGQSVEKVQADRPGMALAAAKFTHTTVVLKGAGTIVAHYAGDTAINITGNPGMATGGTGDVLAGLMAGIIAQGVPPYDAARLAVYLHGRAGDLGAWEASQPGLTAGDVVGKIPYAYKWLMDR